MTGAINHFGLSLIFIYLYYYQTECRIRKIDGKAGEKNVRNSFVEQKATCDSHLLADATHLSDVGLVGRDAAISADLRTIRTHIPFINIEDCFNDNLVHGQQET